MPKETIIELYSDLHCPYAYVTTYRLRKLREEYQGRVAIAYRSLALEYVNKRSTPKFILDNEAPFLMLQEPEIPYQPWSGPDSEWPVTMWPAFEAVKCAERQSPALAAELDWTIRRAFFADNRCISMRYVLIELADQAGLDMRRFAEDFDDGVCKRQVLAEAQTGWEQLKVRGSPTFVLASGKQVSYPGLPQIELDEERNGRVVAFEPAPCRGPECLATLRALFDEALSG